MFLVFCFFLNSFKCNENLTQPLWALPWEWVCLKVKFSCSVSPCFIKYSLLKALFLFSSSQTYLLAAQRSASCVNLSLEIPLSSADTAKANVCCGLISLPLHWHRHYPLPLQVLQLFRGSVLLLNQRRNSRG